MATELQRCLQALQSGERRVLAQTLSRVESTRQEDRDFVVALLRESATVPAAKLRVGITGAPGVGKSTLIGAFGMHLLQQQREPLAVLAVDPASPHSHGSILGDKLRMGELAAQEKVFVRPLAGRGAEGGVHVSMPEMVRICELAGYRTIIVETIGSGQGDFAIKHSVDVVVTLLSGGGGDMVQGLKKGLNEMTDVFVISKHDGKTRTLAEQAYTALRQALQLSSSAAPVVLTSALASTGLEELHASIEALRDAHAASGNLQHNRDAQRVALFKAELARVFKNYLFAKHASLLTEMAEKITAENLPPSVAVQAVRERLGW